MEKKILSILFLLSAAVFANAQDITSYRGAFAPAPEKMWTDSWVNWDPQNAAYGTPNVNVPADTHLTGTANVWTSNNVYLLQGLVYIDSLATLTIEPGTVIRGAVGTNASLIVRRGGKVLAEGTQCSPIVFTSNAAAGARAVGNWGGIILLGKARNNAPGGLLQIEGLAISPLHQHGGTDDSDNSGILKYVRIEYGGFVFASNNEINGLTMGSVGVGTTIDYVQTSFINDDAFEWFGGNVNAKHLVSFRNLDDDWDTDFGYSGTVQYGLSVKDPALADVPAVSTSEGWESDNDPSGTNESLQPKTSAKFYNITQIGAFRCASNAAGSGVTPTVVGFQRAARIRRNSDLKIVNSILMNNWRGVHFDGALALANVDQDSLIFRNNIVAGDFSTLWAAPYTSPSRSVAAFDANSRTRLFNPAYANDSLNSCAVLTNAWNFLNPDYRPNTGGDGAIVIDPTNLSAGADVTPFIEIDGGLFTANQSQDFLGDVLENGGGSTTGTVTVTIPKLSGWSIGVEGITLVSGGPIVSGISNTSNVNGGTANSNGNWNFRDDGTNIIATSKPGVVIEKFGFVQLGFTATRLAGTSVGTNQNLSVNLGGGGDVTPANNGTVTIFSAN